MKNIHKSVLIWYSPDEMFRLVTDVARYPEFLPWCDQARVLESDEHGMLAEVGISLGGIQQSFTTRNTHEAGRSVGMSLVKGPFSNLSGIWQFIPVGDGTQRACKVELDLQYGFSSKTLAALVGPVFDKIAASLTPAMVEVTLCWSLQPRKVHELTVSVAAGSSVQAVVEQFIAGQGHV
eukprot:gene1040-1018_t